MSLRVKKNRLEGEGLLDENAQLRAVLGEITKTFRELLGGHGILVHGPAERLLVESDLLLVGFAVLAQFLLEGLGGVGELVQKLGADGQLVASGEAADFAGVTERSAHDDGVVAELLVVLVDVANAEDARVILGGVLLLVGVLLEPVEDAAHEGRDESGAGLFVYKHIDMRKKEKTWGGWGPGWGCGFCKEKISAAEGHDLVDDG